MPLLWISLAFLVGLLLASVLSLPAAAWLAAGVTCLLLWPVLRLLPQRGLLSVIRWPARQEPRLLVPPLLLAAALALGAARMASSGPDLAAGHIAAWNNRGAVRLIAVVDAPPDRRDRSTLYRLKVEYAAALDGQGRPDALQPAHGFVLTLIPGRAEWEYGDRLSLDGSPVTPPENEGFSYRAYLARQEVYTYLAYPRVRRLDQHAASPLMESIYRLRGWAYAEVFHLFPSPEAPLLAGILLGIDSDLPDALARAFQDTGTAHVIAISGFNIAILGELFSKLFGKFLSRWWATIASILAITGYTILVGGTPSVVRAAIMGSLALIGQQIGRRSAGANTLAFTAMLMSIRSPQLPWDPSFQLSFGATLGLILYGDRLQNGFSRWLERRLPAETARKIAGPVGEYVLMTLAAQLLTLPVILYHFQRLSLSSLIANPLVLPPQPLVMVLSGLAVLAGAVSDPLAHALAWLAWPLSAYTNRIVELLASIPNGVLVLGEMNLATVLLMYAAVLAPVVSRRFPAQVRRSLPSGLGMVTLALVAALCWRGAVAAPDGKLHILVYDFDGSQAVLLRAPRGETLLINAGPSTRSMNDAFDRVLSPFDRRIDGLLINTNQVNQLTGLNGVLQTHPTGQVWWGASTPEGRAGEQLVEDLKGLVSNHQRLAASDTLQMGQVTVQVLASTDTGSALLLSWDRFRALIPAGLPPDRFIRDQKAGLSLIILDARDMDKTTAEEWLALAPRAIISSSVKGSIEPGRRNWLITRPQSRYQVNTDGKSLWVERSP